ncbi:MAG: hypothetical protein HYU24_03045 [Candidatus Rokubacteria bacterium]|nr:hypothetical protein [Candidatus Rokubacteria bacterium]
MQEPFFLRHKEVRIVRLADDFHHIRASLTIEYPSMRVLHAENRYGCPHLMEVITDIGRAAFQIHMANLRKRALETPDLAKLLDQPLEKRKFALGAMPRLADSCWVFNTANDERFEQQWREQQQ